LTHPPLPEADNLPAWRAQLLDRLLYLTLVASIIPCGLVSYQALRDGSWTHALLCWCTAGLLAAVKRHIRWPHAVRALGGALLLYGFGLWLLMHGAAVGMLYLLAFPVMVALILNTAAATLSLFVSTVTLTAVGWWLELPIPMVVGLPGDQLLRWVTMSSNLLLLGILMTLAAGFLLRHLEQAMASHRHSATLLREVATQVPGMVFRLRLDDRWVPRFLFVSPGSQDVLGLSPSVLMADATAVKHRLHPDDLGHLRALISAVRAGTTHHEAELRVLTATGQTRWLQMQATEVERQAHSVVLNGVLIDITERKRAEAMVQRQAYFDTLTGLPNRLSLQTELARRLDDAQRQATCLALLLVDLDRFKEVNDTQGHAGGDALLMEASQRLQGCLGEGGFVARVGGDEFVLLLPTVDSDREAEALGQRVLQAMSQVFNVSGQQCFISASVGIALYPDDARTADELLIDADQALYEAKGSGRDRCCRFTAALHDRAQRRIRLAHELRSAIERGQLSLVYQPIVDLHGGEVRKAEALLRWQHPELGAVSPAEFVPIAESTGLIGDIGAWVLATAAHQARLWRQSLDPAFRIAINHSPLQFRSEYAPALPWTDQLAALGVPGEALIVEITEGLLLDHSDALAQQLRELRASGVQVALDDFGTGYSALAYLHRFEIDLLKIDRSFVSGEGSGQTGRSLCRAMVALSQELGLQVVAEGVETAEQRDWLSGIGCHQAQGWLYGRGMPPAEFERWYARHTETQALTA
jgi:diguanylate cyclase (GGDEF)-like protein/PAS domain S-box-containing protein